MQEKLHKSKSSYSKLTNVMTVIDRLIEESNQKRQKYKDSAQNHEAKP